MTATAAPQIRTENDPAAELLDLFYPIHYKGGLTLEDVMRRGQLSRKQVAILWLIRSEGENGRQMRRKDIEQVIQSWFEVSSSTITKALHGMARPPLGLVRILDNPHSGREKQVLLTSKGERFLSAMVTEGREFEQRIVEQLSETEVREGIRFLRKAVAIFERARAERPLRNGG
jgi:DNA-binding MarR family transcriptional regulator